MQTIIEGANMTALLSLVTIYKVKYTKYNSHQNASRQWLLLCQHNLVVLVRHLGRNLHVRLVPKVQSHR